MEEKEKRKNIVKKTTEGTVHKFQLRYCYSSHRSKIAMSSLLSFLLQSYTIAFYTIIAACVSRVTNDERQAKMQS